MQSVGLRAMGLKTALAVAVIMGSAFSANAQNKELIPVKLRLDWVWQSPQSIFTIAAERGYYRDEGLDVTIDRGYGGMENATALANGNYDFLFGGIDTAMLFNAKSKDVKLKSVFVIYDAYLGTVIVRKDSGITKPKDLEGKTIGAPLTTGGRTMFPAFAKANGIDASKVKWDTVSIQLQDQQFAQGKFDGVASFVTTSLLNLQQLGMKRDQLTIFNFADYGVDLYGSGVVARADYIEKNPEVIAKFLRATTKGLKAMMESKAEAIATLKKRDPLLDVKTETDRLDLMIEITLKRPSVEKNGVSYVDPARLQRGIDTLASVFEITPVPKADELYTDKFLPPQADRMLKF